VGASRPSSNQSDRTQADELAALTEYLARTDRHRIARTTKMTCLKVVGDIVQIVGQEGPGTDAETETLACVLSSCVRRIAAFGTLGLSAPQPRPDGAGDDGPGNKQSW